MISKELSTRFVTAGVMIGVIVLLELLSQYTCTGRAIFVGTAFLLIVGAAYEFARFSNRLNFEIPRFVAYLLLSVFPALAVLLDFTGYGFCAGAVSALDHGFSLIGGAIAISLLFGVLFTVVSGHDGLEGSETVSREFFVANVLIGLGGGVLVALACNESHRALFWIISVAAASDIAAYFVGTRVGGPKLSPIISPGKTISGALGGLGAGTVVGVLLSWMTGVIGLTWLGAIGLSLMVTAGSQVADLGKSYLKRLHQVKDSGSVFPGHGGVLDRVDASLGAAVMYYALLRLVFV